MKSTIQTTLAFEEQYKDTCCNNQPECPRRRVVGTVLGVQGALARLELRRQPGTLLFDHSVDPASATLRQIAVHPKGGAPARRLPKEQIILEGKATCFRYKVTPKNRF
jgi:hypothetical protein